ncbi:MAG: hypothetical protein ACI4JJ_08925 [Huintestinicola sp.]
MGLYGINRYQPNYTTDAAAYQKASDAVSGINAKPFSDTISELHDNTLKSDTFTFTAFSTDFENTYYYAPAADRTTASEVSTAPSSDNITAPSSPEQPAYVPESGSIPSLPKLHILSDDDLDIIGSVSEQTAADDLSESYSSYNTSSEPQQSPEPITSSEYYAYDDSAIESIFEESAGRIDDFKGLLKDFFSNQADHEADAVIDSIDLSALSISEDGSIDVNFTPEAFKGLENLDWSSDATAQRIFDFARSMCGDGENMDMMKASVFAAFGEIEDNFGGAGQLPQALYDTLDKLTVLFNE